MKKRILSIMDTGKKRTGIAIACVVLIATIGTGFAFAANVSPIYANNDSSGSTTIHDSEIPYDAADKYGKYAEFGLTLDMTSGNLYYNGELIRYFEDWYPISEDGNAYAGIDYFNEHGTIDAHGVRNLTKIVRNTDGSYDPSGVLIGVEPYSQAEFDARDIDKLKNPPQNNATAVSNSDYANGIDYRGASNFILSDETAEEFKVYAEFGLTYDDDDVFRYQGKTVRRFIDLGGVLTFTRAVPNDYDKSVDLTAVRDMSGKLTGISQASREEFEERTKQIVQSQKEQEEFLKNHPNVTAYSTNPTAGSEPGNSTATAGTTYCIGQETSNRDSATSNNHDFVDTSLNDYIDYGVSYDNVSKAWVFNGKSIYFLLDSGHQVYLNFREDNTSDDFADKIAASNGVFIKVLRNSVGSIDKIIEMTVEEAVNAISNLLG